MVHTATPSSEEQTWERTIDLADLARVNRGDRVQVEKLEDKTQGLFSRTINLLEVGRGRVPVQHTPSSRAHPEERYVPENEALRKVYLFAEALGGYEALNDLSSKYSPGQTLSRRMGKRAQTRALRPEEVRIVEEYHQQVTDSKNANRYLLANKLEDFSHDELYELYEMLKLAKARSEEMSEILGIHLIHEIEFAVQQLHDLREKIRGVDKTLSGIFLVESEVMFIPTYDLIRYVGSIFKAVGNPYVANNVDGVLLLAGRNLLIDVISFYSYYGKQQIYNAFAGRGGASKAPVIAMHIRHEIRNLFKAVGGDCRQQAGVDANHERRGAGVRALGRGHSVRGGGACD